MFLSLIKPFCSLEIIYGIVLVKKYKMHGTPVLVRVARGLSDFVLFRVCTRWYETLFGSVFVHGESNLTLA